MRFRSAIRRDLDELEDVDDASADVFRGIGYDFSSVVPASRQARFWRAFDDGIILVADIPHANLAGFAAVLPVDEDAHVLQLSVRRANQGKGVGRRLMQHVEEWARREGYPGMTLTTFRDVAWNAPFYASLGFVEIAADDSRPGLKEEREQEVRRGLDAIGPRLAMRKPLT